MDTKDLKGFLYGWLGKRKIGQPSYNITSFSRGGTERFKCELRVPGYTYVGLGNSLNKKDAATNAAMDYCNYLVRQGLLDATEVPALNASSLEATSSSSSSNNYGFDLDSNKGSFFMPGSNQNNGDHVWMAQSSSSFTLSSTYDRYVKQKAEEIAQSESVDLVSEIHGGWTMDNSKKALNEFLQKLRQPPIVYNTNLKEANNCRTFISEASIYVPQLKKQISGRGQGSAKKVAESGCSMAIVRQLFHLGIMAEFKGERRKNTVENLPELPLSLPAHLIEKINVFIQTSGVKPVIANVDSVSLESPQSLICNYKLDQFPECEVFPAGNISWAPPMQNWNPWRSSNIDEPPLAFMSLREISAKIGEIEACKTLSSDIQGKRMALPVIKFKQKILDTVRENRVTLIKGETGCGKSTQVAQYLLDYFVSVGRGAEFNAFISQPRRISAIFLAERVSAERGEEIGETVGYGVRFDSVSPRPYGAIMFCTVGVLLRKMESGLRGISHIIIDEIHERDVNTDFILVVLREMVREYSDLRVILMSATIDTRLFTEFFGNCPVIEMRGRTYPVEHYFLEDVVSMLNYMPPLPEKRAREDDEEVCDKSKNLNLLGCDVPHNVRQAMSYISEKEIPLGVIEAILTDISYRGESGSVLIFLPGWNEIMLVMNFLNYHDEFSNQSNYVILPLHSQLTGAEQRKVFDHYGSNIRKIILSTNIAETSITIDDVVFVIDSCKVKERMYTSSNNMVHFATVWASRTNLVQRRGRAGRVRPGFTFHLCSKQRFDALDEHRTAEILRTPLHEIALTIKLLRLGSVGDFLAKAIEPPPYDIVVESEAVLQNMGALDSRLELTDLGRILARLPIEPLMGKTIVLGIALGVGALMCDIAAASSFSTPFIPRERTHARLNSGQRSFAGTRWSDHIALVAVNQAYKEAEEVGVHAEQSFCNRFSLSTTILKMTGGAKRQLVDVLSTQCGFPLELLADTPINPNGFDQKLDLLSSLLVAAFYPNICYYRGKRKVYTLEQASALVAKSSIITPFQGDNDELPSPLLVFTEKLRTRVISCKQLSVISAIQLLIFGCRKVECVGPNLVRLDEMITIRMDVSVAASLVALRPCIDALLVRTCCNPSSLLVTNEHDRELCALIEDLSSTDFFVGGPMKDHLLTDAAQVMVQPISSRRGRWGRGRDWVSGNSFANGSFQGDITYKNIRMQKYGNMDDFNKRVGGDYEANGSKWSKASRRGNDFMPYPSRNVRFSGSGWRSRGRRSWL